MKYLSISFLTLFIGTATFFSCNIIESENKDLTPQQLVVSTLSEQDIIILLENEYLEINDVAIQFTEHQIISQSNGNLVFVANNTDKSVKMGIVVNYDENNGLYSIGNETTCTCTGCDTGCDPEHLGGNSWKCTSCSAGANNSLCEKSVTAKGE